MYEAEDLKSRLQQSSGAETGRRKRSNRHGPYETVTRTTTVGSPTLSSPTTITTTNSTKTSTTRTMEHDEVTSSSDNWAKRVTPLSHKVTGKPTTKQPTLVELLQAGVERPPFGPPRLSAQHTAATTQRQTNSTIESRPSGTTPNTCNRSCILQLLQCPPIKNRRATSSSEQLSTSSGPVIVEADSSNLPLDEDLLQEMMSTEKSMNSFEICPMCQMRSQDLAVHLRNACTMTR